MGLSSSPLPKRTSAKSTARQSMQESSLPILSDQLSPQVLHHEMKFLRKRMDERRLLMWKQLSLRLSISKRGLEEMMRPTSQFLSRSDKVPLNSLKCLEQQVQHPKARFLREHMSRYLNQLVRIALALWLMACSHAWIVAMLFSLPNGVSVVWSFIDNVLSSFQRLAVTPTSGFLQTVFWTIGRVPTLIQGHQPLGRANNCEKDGNGWIGQWNWVSSMWFIDINSTTRSHQAWPTWTEIFLTVSYGTLTLFSA